MKLSLGTAQFGLNYGIANSLGQISPKDVGEILVFAKNFGVKILDTAIAYGESEKILGEHDLNSWQIITKLPEIPLSTNVENWIIEQFRDALQRLNVAQIHGLLLHRPNQLLSAVGDKIWQELLNLKNHGLVEKIGVSVYSPHELETLIGVFPIDLVQCPVNIFDRSLEISGWAKRLKKMDIEIHARSIFLQGLLLMPSHRRPAQFEKWRSVFDAYDRWLENKNITALEASLNYVNMCDFVNKMIVGIDSLEQLKQIVTALNKKIPDVPIFLNPREENLINPSKWSAL